MKPQDKGVRLPGGSCHVLNLDFTRIDFVKNEAAPMIKTKTYPDYKLQQIITEFKTHIYVDRQAVSESIDFDYPYNWWHQLKYEIFFEWPRWIRKLFRMNPDKIKMQKKTRKIEFIKDYFPDNPGWHKDLYYKNDGEKHVGMQVLSHESIRINGEKRSKKVRRKHD